VYFGSVSSADAAPIQVVAIVAATDATNTLFRIDFRCGFIVLPPGDSKSSCGDESHFNVVAAKTRRRSICSQTKKIPPSHEEKSIEITETL